MYFSVLFALLVDISFGTVKNVSFGDYIKGNSA